MPKGVSSKAAASKGGSYDTAFVDAVEKSMDKKSMPSTDDLFKKAEDMGVDPFSILLHIADGNKMALDLDVNEDDDKPISPELRAMAARECLKFLYPTMKSTEVSGKGGKDLPALAVRVLFGPENQ